MVKFKLGEEMRNDLINMSRARSLSRAGPSSMQGACHT